MNKEIPRPDPALTPEQLTEVAQLSEAEIAAIDKTLLSSASHEWRKVAMVVAMAAERYSDSVSIPDIFYSQRVRKLVEDGRLESHGNLAYMRFSEVRLPTPSESRNATKPPSEAHLS